MVLRDWVRLSGTLWFLPNQEQVYPVCLSNSANVAQPLGMMPQYPGYPVAISWITPVATEW
jgi:hypothetical protein